MLFLNKKNNIQWKDVIKRINYQLTSNFFSLKDFKLLSNFQSRRVIKLIAKQNKIKLTRSEIKQLIILIKNIEYHKIVIQNKFNLLEKIFNFSFADFVVTKHTYKLNFNKNTKIKNGNIDKHQIMLM